jgi:hypothetical protein
MVYKIKKKSDESIDRYKVRLVTKGLRKNAILIMKIPLVQLLKLLPLELYYLLRSLDDDVLGNWTYTMLSYMEF